MLIKRGSIMDTDTISRIAESQILEAIEEGKFDNLPGMGKPIVFDDDLSVPMHIRLANKVLKNAGVVPDWVQFRRDILEERAAVEAAFARLSAENDVRRQKVASLATGSNYPRFLAYAQWRSKSRETYLAMLKSVNTSILKFCMSAPSSASGAGAFAPYRVDSEMRRFDEALPPISETPSNAPDEEQYEGMLRSAARMRYETSKITKTTR
jgi:DnaJ homolog subfamily C member 28